MKQFMLILVVLTALQVSVQANVNNSYALEGIWLDRNYDHELEIRYYSKGLKVKLKGLFRKTKKFREVKRGIYADHDGNSIELLNREKLIWKSSGDRDYRVFFKQGRYSGDRWNNSNNRRYSDNRYSNTRTNQRNRNMAVISSNRGRNSSNSRTRSYNSGIRSFDGRWECSRGRNDLYIESFDGGFRSRRSKNGRWLNFYRDRNNPNRYTCENGERYEFRNNELRWTGRNSCDNLRFRRRG